MSRNANGSVLHHPVLLPLPSWMARVVVVRALTGVVLRALALQAMTQQGAPSHEKHVLHDDS